MTAKEELRSTPHPALFRRERVLLTAHEMFQVPTHNVQTPGHRPRPVRRLARVLADLSRYADGAADSLHLLGIVGHAQGLTRRLQTSRAKRVLSRGKSTPYAQ